MTETTNEYVTIDTAFTYFNETLFEKSLPDVMFTLQRKAGTRGYFCGNSFVGRESKVSTSEIALNPDSFAGRTDKDIFSTLVHEMCHLWQHCYGDPGLGKYHNAEWAKKMLEVGLHPISAKDPEKMVGQSVSHEIVPGGLFDQFVDLLLGQGVALRWQSLPTAQDDKQKTAKKKSKTKYTCPGCEANAWAKPGVNLVCGDCMQAMQALDEEENEEEN